MNGDDLYPKGLHTCSICEEYFTGWGNNAQPVNDGRCCDACNMDVVIPIRLIRLLARRRVTETSDV